MDDLVERCAKAMKPELFAGGPDADRAPTVVYERNIARGYARAIIPMIYEDAARAASDHQSDDCQVGDCNAFAREVAQSIRSRAAEIAASS